MRMMWEGFSENCETYTKFNQELWRHMVNLDVDGRPTTMDLKFYVGVD